MVDREHPCARGLTAGCFGEYPAWAKQAFAYRLMHTIFPARVTGRLPGKMGEPLIGPGAIVPPDVVIPPGVVVPPGYEWPPLWTPWDPWPPGMLPPPMPPDDIPDGGAVPPIYVPPFEPGPPHRPSPSPPTAEEVFFSDPFDDLDNWTNTSAGAGTAEIDDKRLKFSVSGGWSDRASVERTEPKAWPENFDLSFLLNYASGGERMRYHFYTGALDLEIVFSPPTTIVLTAPEPLFERELTVANYVGADHVWKLIVTGAMADLYRDTDLIFSGHEFPESTETPGYMYLSVYKNAITYTDDMLIEATEE